MQEQRESGTREAGNGQWQWKDFIFSLSEVNGTGWIQEGGCYGQVEFIILLSQCSKSSVNTTSTWDRLPVCVGGISTGIRGLILPSRSLEPQGDRCIQCQQMTGGKAIPNTATDEVNMEGLVRVRACDWDFARQIDRSRLPTVERQTRERRAVLGIASQNNWCVDQRDSICLGCFGIGYVESVGSCQRSPERKSRLTNGSETRHPPRVQ